MIDSRYVKLYSLITIFSLLVTTTLLSTRYSTAQYRYVYYGFVPTASSDMGNVIELVDGVVSNFTPPSGHAILDIVGTEDNTKVEVYDILNKRVIAEFTIDRLKKETLFIPYGTFFRVSSDKRVAAYLFGGSGYPGYGSDTFYLSVDGGFIGKEFIFLASTMTDSYSAERRGVNLWMYGIESSDYKIVDSSGFEVGTGHVDMHGSKGSFLACRVAFGDEIAGAGNSIIFDVSTSGDVLTACLTSSGLMAVPAVTGGFVGRLFVVPAFLSLDEPGATVMLIVVPLEAGEVKVYDESLREMLSHTFSDSDVAQMKFWYHNLGKTRRTLLIKSTCDITVMVGNTLVSEDIDHLGDDITFLGTKPNQEVRFYAPTMAVVFAPKECDAIIDGVSQHLVADNFVLLEKGVHSVKANTSLIIEVLATPGTWDHWGNYLISPDDVDIEYTPPEGFGEARGGGLSMTMIGGIVVVVVIVVLVGYAFMRRRRRR